MKASIIGTGYVGLVTGACLADVGNHVLCFDVDERKIGMLRAGDIPIFEPGLKEIVRNNVASGRLAFTTDAKESATYAKLQMIAVGTPPGEDGSADLQYVIAAARSIAKHMDGPRVIVDKSTVPVGTADKVRDAVAAALKERGASHAFAMVSNPEFLKEGAAVEDFMRPDRIVIGAEDPDAIATMRELYGPFQRNHERLQVMDIRSAELTKYAANAMLATRISFMNELAALADKLGADIEKVRKGIGSDPRIGAKFLFPGVGFGGSCFPKDLRALRDMGRANGINLGIIEATVEANERSKKAFAARVIERFGGSLTGKRVALWGLAFKPETDDIREAPALDVFHQLRAAGATVVGYDPIASDNVRGLLGDAISIADDPYVAAEGADAVLLLTEWHQLRQPDYARLRQVVRTPVLFDGRNVWDPVEARRAGFEYSGIGRPMTA
jgi:UDPglucose 6-dehydrogenase